MIFFLKDNTSFKCNKYDIKSAFISSLKQEDLWIPVSNISVCSLVNEDPDIFFKQLRNDDKSFGFVKAFIINQKNEEFNFFFWNSETNGFQNNNCFKCAKIHGPIKTCNHGEKERGFFVETYISDLLYYRQNNLGTIKVVHILYFKSKHNKNLSYLADLLISNRKTKTNIHNIYCKNIALIGLGRFAFNVSKNFNQKNMIIESYDELSINLEKGMLQNIDFYEKCILARKKYKLTNYDNYKISARLNCCSLLFGVVNNRIRRECYDIYLKVKKIENFNILRLHTDSFIISFPLNKEYLIQEKLFDKSKFQYKLEYENIEFVKNLKKRSHFFKCQGKIILKIPGLSLNVIDRNNPNLSSMLSLNRPAFENP